LQARLRRAGYTLGFAADSSFSVKDASVERIAVLATNSDNALVVDAVRQRPSCVRNILPVNERRTDRRFAPVDRRVALGL